MIKYFKYNMKNYLNLNNLQHENLMRSPYKLYQCIAMIVNVDNNRSLKPKIHFRQPMFATIARNCQIQAFFNSHPDDILSTLILVLDKSSLVDIQFFQEIINFLIIN